MSMNFKDTEHMADDVQTLADDLEKYYIANGEEVPPPMRLIIQAQCAWTLMLHDRIFKNQRSSKPLAPVSSIILPNGRPPT